MRLGRAHAQNGGAHLGWCGFKMAPVRKTGFSKNTTAAQSKWLKSKADLCIQGRKHANELVDVISFCLAEDPAIICTAVKCIHKIFACLVQEGKLCFSELLPSDDTISGVDVHKQYRLWLQERYKDALLQLVDLLHHENVRVQRVALSTLMKLAVVEGNQSHESMQEEKIIFPVHIIKDIMGKFLSTDVNMVHVIAKFQEYLEYTDVKFHTMKIVSSWLKHLKNTPGNLTDTLFYNTFAVLSLIKLKPVSGRDKDLPEENTNVSLLAYDNEDKTFVPYDTQQKKLFSSMWLNFLKFRLPRKLYMKVLISLHDQVIPHLQKPLLLTDFLTESYNTGGAVSLLALNGLFMLIKRYNLEYPDFYKKLYSLLQPDVFTVKYRARFFYLTDLFLTSTHLPAYLVAAFAKRLARLALLAPVHMLPLLVPFVGNLLIRHPNLQTMIHKPDGPEDMTSDPYMMEESVPLKSRAIESCLWELKTLQSHWHPDISTKAKIINGPLPSVEWDLSQLYDLETSQLMEQCQKTFENVPLNHEMPTALFECKEEKTSFWSV